MFIDPVKEKHVQVAETLFAEIIKLEPEQLALDEVVVVGYGTNDRFPESVSEEARVFVKAKPVDDYRQFREYIDSLCFIPEGYTPQKNVVRIKLAINEKGEITGIEKLNSPDSVLFEKAKKIILARPEWVPASIDGSPVESTVTLKLKFKNQND